MVRGKKFGTVEVRFREVATARLHSEIPLRTEEMVLQLFTLRGVLPGLG